MSRVSAKINGNQHKMTYIFFNEKGILRSGWRAAIFLFAFICSGLVLGTIAIAGLTQLGVDAPFGSTTFLVMNACISLVLALGLGWLAGRLLEKLPFKALGA